MGGRRMTSQFPSRSGCNPPGYGASGVRTCPTCKGTGINPMLPTKVCPKCNGETKVWG